tara:strand:- start:1210 stop:1929 length:720 start_codon:yes stop_codon:yes gene_type:complete
MSKISTYPIQSVIVGADKWIGTDSVNAAATKNFTANDVATFLNINNKIESTSLRYRFQNWVTGEVRRPGTISFTASQVGSPAFNTLTSFLLSKNMFNSSFDVSSYYSVPLITSAVLISQCDDPANFGIYTWNTATQYAPETNFYSIGVSFKVGSGNLTNDKDYFISLLTYGPDAGDKNYVFTQGTNSATWVVNHGLNKYPSVSVVNNAGITVYGQVEYDSLNQVTITFKDATNGQAFFN